MTLKHLCFKALCYHAPNWNQRCSLSTQTHSGQSRAIFRGSISSPDEELCMDHLRSGSGKQKLWLRGGWSADVRGEGSGMSTHKPSWGSWLSSESAGAAVTQEIGFLKDKEKQTNHWESSEDTFLCLVFFSLSYKQCDYDLISDQSKAGAACLWIIVCVFMCVGTDGVCGGGKW